VIDPPLQDTGHPRVDEVLRSLAQLDDRPVAEHVAVYEVAHRVLHEALTAPEPLAPEPLAATAAGRAAEATSDPAGATPS
jgi:hypothetical protein